jgi:hypothetical protein
VKSKMLFISLAVVLALSLVLTGCPTNGGGGLPDKPANDTLIIGTARDTNDALAIFEQVAAGPVMREFVAQVNADGGVHLSAYDTESEDYYADLEIDRREINGTTLADVADVTAEICADIDDGVDHFLFGGPGTDCIFIQAPIANGAKVVLLTFEGGATVIANDPLKLAKWPYVFLTLSYSDWYQLPVLADTLAAQPEVTNDPPKAYVLHIEGEHGDEYLAVAEDNFDVVADVEIPFDPTSYAPLADGVMDAAIAALNATPYDIFCCFAYPDHVIMTTASAMAKGFNPPAMVFGPGANFGFYAYSFGGPPPDPTLVDGILGFTVSAYNGTGVNPEITDVYDAIAARMDDDDGDPDSGIPGLPGILALDYWGIPCYWAGLEMWLQGVEGVGYVDQELLRDALAGFEDDPVTTVMADETWFRMYGDPGEGGGNLDYLCHTGEIGQWQNGGTFATVGPVDSGEAVPGLDNYVVTGNFSDWFPMTGLWNWLP